MKTNETVNNEVITDEQYEEWEEYMEYMDFNNLG